MTHDSHQRGELEGRRPVSPVANPGAHQRKEDRPEIAQGAGGEEQALGQRTASRQVQEGACQDEADERR